MSTANIPSRFRSFKIEPMEEGLEENSEGHWVHVASQPSPLLGLSNGYTKGFGNFSFVLHNEEINIWLSRCHGDGFKPFHVDNSGLGEYMASVN